MKFMALLCKNEKVINDRLLRNCAKLNLAFGRIYSMVRHKQQVFVAVLSNYKTSYYDFVNSK